jgi:hypothetical protein
MRSALPLFDEMLERHRFPDVANFNKFFSPLWTGKGKRSTMVAAAENGREPELYRA